MSQNLLSAAVMIWALRVKRNVSPRHTEPMFCLELLKIQNIWDYILSND